MMVSIRKEDEGKIFREIAREIVLVFSSEETIQDGRPRHLTPWTPVSDFKEIFGRTSHPPNFNC